MKTKLDDGLYIVHVGPFTAGFEVKDGEVISCAPVLRTKFSFWAKRAKRVSTPKPTTTHEMEG
jgi:hypothetical protein